ncbi:phage holin family protein [Mobilicoccus sp.]|uniref:phage holin family protein n=1 Tax=Mobilicoccus sp. TaxID=2034349 RepID=UPI0028AE325E|nr:phage holin family protein [Mobilicoccus sp.]
MSTSASDPSDGFAENRASTGGSTPAGAPRASTHHATSATTPVDDLSLGDRLSAITEDISTLMRQEIALAKAEAMQSGKQAGKGVGMFGGAGVAGHLALIFVSLALAWGLGELFDIGLGWGALIVGLVWAVVAAVLAQMGKKNVQNLGMPQTVDTAKRIPDAMKGNETR